MSALKLKLIALTGMSLALVVTAACSGGGGGDSPPPAVQQACNQVARICKDGSNAVKEGTNSCYQKCPEDTGTHTSVSTVTETITQTRTN